MLAKPAVYLSKSQYLRGLQCHRALWLYRNRRELMAAPDANREAIFATGHEVGKLAQQRFPGGVEIEFDAGNFDAMVERTAELIQQGREVIYEATFVSDGLLAMADILLRNGDGWDFYEVKSSTRVKPYHLHDTALQWRILAAHIKLERAHVMHINNRYSYDGELDLQQLFSCSDVTARVLQMQAGLPTRLASMQTMLEGTEPDTPIGVHCHNPFECDFMPYCWRSVPNPSVFDLYQMRGERKFELYHQGLVSYGDLQKVSLSPAQSLQVDTALSGEIHIERQRLDEFIGSANYPLYFLDFETLQQAVPKFIGQRPYEQLPFQYSLHLLQADGELEHREFLADEHSDPRPALAEQLLADLGTSGTIVAYSQSTEIAAINNLANHCPELATALRACLPRFLDLLTPFRHLMYYHPAFNGSLSIKSVLPAMFPDDREADYAQLEIQDGRSAMTIYNGLADIDDEVQRQQTRDALLAYCKLDTLAMVRIWQALADVAEQ